MNQLETISKVREWVEQARRSSRRIGFVPTMGALHEGHRSLMRAARAQTDRVIVSIFVNPTQFGPGEDFERYPRPLEADLTACREEVMDAVFCPAVDEIYPPGSVTEVNVRHLTAGLCGTYRPGHFTGVATVVAKLFNIVQPDDAFFGQKDVQQVTAIRRMVQDLCWPIRIVVCPTVRESDGLAMSSRNVYLSAEERVQARSLSAALRWAEEQIRVGRNRSVELVGQMRRQIEAAGPGSIDYVEIVDADDLQPKATVEGRCLVVLAVRIGKTRLIDNVVVDAIAGGA